MSSPRIEAAKKGEKRYIGKPCKTCGSTLRYTINTGCVECTARATKRNVEGIKALLEQARAGVE